MAQHITVVDYDPSWPQRYQEEIALLTPVLSPDALACYHIGSTAVPNLAAKPIIDILVVVRDVVALDKRAQDFARLGYEYLGEFGLKGRRYLRKGGAERTHQIHIFDLNSEEQLVRHLAVRDFLRTHYEYGRLYAALKRELAQRFPYSIDGYCEGKESFMQELERKALAWFDPTWDKLYWQARAVQGDRLLTPLVQAGQVSAALLTRQGHIFVGVCIDTACSLGMCAERSAIASMITAGESKIVKLVAVMPDGAVGMPCGACRELLLQLGAAKLEILADLETKRVVKLSELMPAWWA